MHAVDFRHETLVRRSGGAAVWTGAVLDSEKLSLSVTDHASVEEGGASFSFVFVLLAPEMKFQK